jgi:hypothetical protein
MKDFPFLGVCRNIVGIHDREIHPSISRPNEPALHFLYGIRYFVSHIFLPNGILASN